MALSRPPLGVWVLLAMAWGMPAASGAGGPDSAAAVFASEGLKTTLATCDLPRSCNGKKPVRQSQRFRETGNDTSLDERHLSFDGLDIEFAYVLGNKSMPPETRQRARARPKRVILSLEVSTSDWPVAHGLKVGSPRATVEARLGKRGHGADECVTYANEMTQDETVICYQKGKVRTIQWVPWWDG